MYEVGDAA